MTTQPGIYRIRVRGHLDPSWSARLGGMTIEADGDDAEPMTILSGELMDQSALAGIVNALVDLHLSVVSVESVGENERDKDRSREDVR